MIPSLRRSLRLRCLDGRDGLAGSLVGGGPLPPPAPPPENNAIPLVHAKGVDLSTYVKRSYFHCLSRSRVERASPRHSRGIRRIRSLFSSSLLPANESLEGIRMCIYIYIYICDSKSSQTWIDRAFRINWNTFPFFPRND